MAKEILDKARAYEQARRPALREELPIFHVTGGVGWINDPNGFAPYKGEYHLFFQYYPYDIQWGPMHWGHVKTRDFIRWEFLPAALAPDTEYDKDGCFSGGAVELPDGRHLLMYTGVNDQPQADGTVRTLQTQCIAIGDGLNYEKYPHNPVITAADLQEGGNTRDFRDPKIWRENGTYYAVTVNRGPDGSGNVLLYESPDALHWKLDGIMAACQNRYGRMWECPDFFHLDGKDVLLHSVMEMQAKGLEFHPGNSKIYHIGRFDREHCRMEDEAVCALEYGLDFYAAQTLETEDGRRIMIAWMQSWESSSRHPEDLHFMGQMTLPRELRIRNGKLCQLPVRELESCRRSKVAYENVPIREECSLPQVRGRVMDMVLELKPTETPYECFDLEIAKSEDFVTTISVFPKKGTIRIDRTYSGFPHDILHVREFPATFRDGGIRLRLVLDRWSAELFVGDGEQAASTVLYTPQSADGIRFRCDQTVLATIEKYDLLIPAE